MSKQGSYAPEFVRKNIAQLRTEREKRGYTLEELSFRTGISFYMLYRYERGEFTPREQNYNALAEIFSWRMWDSTKSERQHRLCVSFFEQEYTEAQEKAKLYGLSLSGLIRQLLRALPLQKS